MAKTNLPLFQPMNQDLFNILAPYYEKIMTRVRYDHWEKKIIALQPILAKTSGEINYLDIACGTGTLLHRLQRYGWKSIGIDISPSMIITGKETHPSYPLCVGDMRNLPFKSFFSIASCLFDSINFLLDEDDLFRALQSTKEVLSNGGIFYFDCVTEEMVRQHYGNEEWKENYKEFKTTWKSSYNEQTRIATLSILIQGKGWTIVRQKLFPVNTFIQAIQKSDLTLLACLDAHTWDQITPTTVRVDFICAKNPTIHQINTFKEIHLKLKNEFQSQYTID